MSERPFHHGNLRAVLIEQAEAMLRTEGVDGLSLRELARQAGVSHGAPRSHFIDRQALLDALAIRGFERLTADVRDALRTDDGFTERFHRVARVYLDFAVRDAVLMELMFATKTAAHAGPVHDAAVGLFRALDSAFERTSVAVADRERVKLAFAATMQGTATLIASHRITPTQGDQVLDDAVSALLSTLR